MSKKLIIFTKYPENGRVKTRLAETLGEAFASEFYKMCAGYIFNECIKLKRSGIDLLIFYAEEEDRNKIRGWVPESFELFRQEGENLGERMYNAFSHLLKFNAEKAVLIGTDIPDISFSLIEKSFEYLDDHEAVIGPSSDGGYYLIGLSKLNKDIFTGIQWSTGKVLENTLIKLKERNLSYKLLPELIDIDKESDIMKWLKTNPADDHPVKKFLNSQNIFYR